MVAGRKAGRQHPSPPSPSAASLNWEAPLAPPPQTYARGEVSFNIDGAHMYATDRHLYNWAITYPAETGGSGLVPLPPLILGGGGGGGVGL